MTKTFAQVVIHYDQKGRCFVMVDGKQIGTNSVTLESSAAEMTIATIRIPVFGDICRVEHAGDKAE